MRKFLIFIILIIFKSAQPTFELKANLTRKLRTSHKITQSAIMDNCETGICMSRFECLGMGGLPKGNCNSLNVCCEVNLKCNSITKSKRILIKNPTNINETPCVYTIRPFSTDVCQLLIEFQKFELQPPTFDVMNNVQECADHLAVGDFVFCGDNSDQHLYMPFNGIPEITLTFNLPNRWSSSVWRLVVTQLECPSQHNWQFFMPFITDNNLPNRRTIFSTQSNGDLELLAPHGCHQYYTKPSGNIKTFNYKADGSAYYLPNMNYVICIKPSGGANMIEYQAQRFSMSNAIPGSIGFDGDCRYNINTPGRREDYLMIPQSYVANSLSILPTYYCGTSLQTYPSLAASAPFIMYFVSDGYTDQAETGFNIRYTVKNIMNLN